MSQFMNTIGLIHNKFLKKRYESKYMNGKIYSDMPILWNEVFSRWISVLKSPQTNLTGTSEYWWEVNIGSGDGLMPSGNKPSPENQCQTRSLSPCGFTTPQGLNSAVPMEHNYYTPRTTKLLGGILVSLRPSVRPSVCPSVRPSVRPACRVRSVTSTLLDGFFPY